jgi:KaiC/GvpD/RAD55 family RecA-like ATPase
MSRRTIHPEDIPLDLGDASAGATADSALTTAGFVGAGEFLGRAVPDRLAIADGLLYDDGSGFIAGEDKTGKTLLAEHLLLALVFARPVGGRFAVPGPSRVLFVEEEDSVRRTHRRLRKMVRGFGLDPDDVAVRAELDAGFRLSVWSGVNLDEDEWWKKLEQEVAAFKPRVLIFDPLSKMTARSLTKAEEIRPVLNRLDALRRRYSIVVLLVHHYRKQQGERMGRGSQEIAGSYVLGAWTEQSLFLEPKDRTGKIISLTLQSKDGPAEPLRVVVVETAETLTVAFEDLPTAAGMAERVWEALGTASPSEPHSGLAGVSVKTLTVVLKVSDKSIRVAMNELVKAGRALEVGKATKQAKLYARNE